MTEKPKPGSGAAKLAGCLCPRVDNHHGRGFGPDNLLFVVRKDCPMHGAQPAETLVKVEMTV